MPCETTQILGTLIVVYGIAMAPIGWWVAAFVWAYTILSFFVANAMKVGTYRLLGHLVPIAGAPSCTYRTPCRRVTEENLARCRNWVISRPMPSKRDDTAEYAGR